MIHLSEVPKVVKLMETENIIVVAKGWKSREIGELLFKSCYSLMPDA